jgi:hypothetical protein
MTKFNLLVNPFTHKILASARVNKIACEEVIYWGGELDWWGTFRMEDKVFDIHLLYEDELVISIYELNNDCDTSYFQNPNPVSIKLISKDQF